MDQHGVVLDILVQDRRNATAAKRFLKRLLAGLKYKPKRLVTDGLRSYGVAHRELMPEVKPRTSSGIPSFRVWTRQASVHGHLVGAGLVMTWLGATNEHHHADLDGSLSKAGSRGHRPGRLGVSP